MQNTIKILGIAPYEELKNTMNLVGKQFEEIELNIFIADLEEGQSLATELENKYDAIISRGGTAELIRAAVSIPVIDISISIYDVLGTIRLASNYTENIAIVGYASITEKAHLLCDILGYNIRIVTLYNSTDVQKVLDQLVEERLEIILCDVITNRIALTKSLDTILITSGIESIKHAYQEAITIAEHLKKEKNDKSLLEQVIAAQNQKYLILDERMDSYLSNLPLSLETSVLNFLKGKILTKKDSQYYHSLQNTVYSIQTRQLLIDGTAYYCCTIKNTTPPIYNNRFGVLYRTKSEVKEEFTLKTLFAKFIQEKTNNDLQKTNNFYNSIIIFGESGTAKSTIAYQAYLSQEIHDRNLITINSTLIDEKMWKYLVNPTNGPLVEENNTVLFLNVEQMSLRDIEQLIITVKNTKLLQRNTLIFTYNKNKTNDETIYNRLLSELQCASIYAPSVKERKNELNVIITLLLNRANIECNKEVIGFDPNAMKELVAYDWPGNFNQLQLAVKELVLNAKTHYISEHQVIQLLKKEQLIQNFSGNPSISFTLKNTIGEPTLFDYTQEIVSTILDQNNGNQTKTAKQLGISRTTLWRYLQKD